MTRLMMLRFFTMLAFFLVLVVLALATRGDVAFAAVQGLYVSAEVVTNTFDGSVLNECNAQHEIESGKKHQMWISFGRVKPQGNREWETVGSNTYCGYGSFDKTGAQIWLPYFIVDIETISSAGRSGSADLQMTLQMRKLSVFDEKGKPVYSRSEQKRRFALGAGDYAIVPLLIADPREIDAFNVHELFVRFQARVIGVEQVAYGTISITADIPGVDILLDGGLVGRTMEDNPVVLSNVLVGKHEVRVRDLSARTKQERIIVEKDRTVDVDLKLLNLPSSPVSANLFPIGKNPQGYEEYWRVRDGAVVVKVPAGEFLMGSAEGEGELAEHPQRRVFVTEFLMDKIEVTWRQFRKFVEATGASLPPDPLWGTPGNYAVSNVLFNEAKTYCEWVGGRLPTEAEWEKAARGTDGRKYPWGNEWDADKCNSLKGGPHRPESVGSFPECLSSFGIVDMAGGVWEWCTDWYADGYPDESARDPKGPETGTQRVIRGASWLNMSEWLRTAYRHKSDPFWRNVLYGFRCVQEVPK